MIKTYKINLDLPGCVRWNNLIDDHKKELKLAVTEIDKMLDGMGINNSMAMSCAKVAINGFSTFADILYEDELRSISKRADIPFTKLVLMQLCYEFFSACTSIVTNVDGRNVHYRTMDWEMPVLKHLTVKLKFYKDNELLYEAVSWAGCVGIMTAMVPKEYSIALNFRLSNGNIVSNIFKMFKSKWLVSYAIRYVLDSGYDFAKAHHFLTKAQLISPCYFTLCNPRGESYVIVRDPEKTIRIDSSTYDNCLIQTNLDHPDNPFGDDLLMSKERHAMAIGLIKGKKYVWGSVNELKHAMGRYPVINDLTIYVSVMDPEESSLDAFIVKN